MSHMSQLFGNGMGDTVGKVPNYVDPHTDTQKYTQSSLKDPYILRLRSNIQQRLENITDSSD